MRATSSWRSSPIIRSIRNALLSTSAVAAGRRRSKMLRTNSGSIGTIERHWDGIAAYCKPENKVLLGFVEGLNNKIRVLQRRAYGLRDEEYLRLKILTCMLQ